MFKVTFKFEGAEDVITYAQEGENLLEIARKSNVAIDAPCSGNASCGKCRVKLIGGEIESPKTRHITDEEYAEGWRLACVSKVTGDVEVQVPDIASAYRSRMKVADLSSKEEVAIFEKAKSDVESAGISLTNSLDVINVKMNVPTLDDTMPDNERLVRAIKKQTGIKKVRMPYSVLRKISYVFRESNFEVQCVIRSTENDIFIYDVYKKDEKVVIGGLAIDIGTTTVSALLIDMKSGEILGKASSGNGQIRYGADVINRIIESMKPGGSEKLQKAVIQETINPMIQQMCRASGFKPEHIYRLSIASNTTMNHLLTGMNGDPIRMEPYIPTFYKTNSLFASDIGIQVNPDAHIIMAPNIGSYVGGDITAGTLVSMLWNRPEFSLFIDLGTNGELVFGNSDFMMSCACSAGPAFEGGDISCGMRATDGAIEACTIDKETMEPTYSIIGEEGQKPVGLCGSGIIDVISELFRTGIINPKGKFVREGKRVRHDHFGMGSYVLAFEEEAGSVKDVEINEVDIDNFIRAKGAIFSAVRTMLASLDFDVSMIDDVYVAGGIGSGINMKNAVHIGMFPDIPLEKFHYIGNSSLSGAYTMLLSRDAERKCYELASNMTCRREQTWNCSTTKTVRRESLTSTTWSCFRKQIRKKSVREQEFLTTNNHKPLPFIC